MLLKRVEFEAIRSAEDAARAGFGSRTAGLGLTISHERGYELSPRGKTVREHLEAAE